jgi:hypothetical protein
MLLSHPPVHLVSDVVQFDLGWLHNDAELTHGDGVYYAVQVRRFLSQLGSTGTIHVPLRLQPTCHVLLQPTCHVLLSATFVTLVCWQDCHGRLHAHHALRGSYSCHPVQSMLPMHHLHVCHAPCATVLPVPPVLPSTHHELSTSACIDSSHLG